MGLCAAPVCGLLVLEGKWRQGNCSLEVRKGDEDGDGEEEEEGSDVSHGRCWAGSQLWEVKWRLVAAGDGRRSKPCEMQMG